EGKENAATGVTTWNETSHTYNTVNSPVVEGYYTDQASVAGQTVTPDDPNKTITVTYHKLGNIVPTDPAGNPIPGHPAVPYTNDPDNPSQVTPNEPVPDIPGYTPDKSTVTPNDPGQDTPVVYTPIINDKTVSTSQTIHYEGAGDSTPADNIQNNFTFEGKENAATGVTTWNETSHTYNTVNSPVVEGYYTDQASVAGQTVTPDDPNKTITVTYHKLGNIVPTDPAGNPIPGHPAVPYTNDPDNPSQVTPNEPVPDIPGYTPDKSTVTPNDPGQDTPVVYTPIINDKTVSTSQTIHYEGAGDSTPADNIQNNFTFEGKENAATGVTTWNETSHTYNTVNSPVVEGYYTDQASVAGQTVTPDDPNKTITVTYHKLGNIVPTDPAGNPIPGHPAVPYTNDPDNPSQVTPNEPVPDIPGYTPDKSTVTPNDPGQDTPVVYTPIINDKTVSTSQTIHYEGAGDSTPADNIQNNFTFEGKENAATGVTTWNETSHTYNTVNSPVVEGYYTDQASVAGQTVTPDDPNKTITVTYHKLGNIVPTDPAGNPIPGHPAVPYTNDPDNPSQVTPNEPVPDIPGYTPDKSTVTPNDPGQDTPVVYTPIINDKTVSTSQTIHYEGAGDSTPADNIQNNFTFEGKENAATGVTTWNETSHTYNTVNSPVVEGYYTDQASVAGQTVTPDDPNKTITVTYHKLGNIVPTDPAGNPIPGHPAVPYTNDPDNPSQVTPNEPVPDIPGYTPDKSTVTPNDPGQDTPVVYTPIINDKTVSTSQTIHYEGAGDSTPADNIQNNFTFEGKENAATGVTTWNETSHTYNTVNSPVVEGYYTDQASVAGQTVTPDDPNKTITVTYHKLGNIVPTDPAGNPIPGHPAVPYTNDPDNPSQVTPNEPVPDIPGYTPDKSTVTPNDPGQDTPVVYTPIINDKTVSTSQTIHYEGAGDSTPADNIQNNFTFEGKENAATGVTTWNETSHTYNTVNSPVVEGYYTDQASVAGQTVTPDDPNKTITVTYHKLGNIVPTDPAGNPIPGHPAVPYTNDPDNPSQVTPNEPVPDIPGYTPDKSTVTPNDPGQDTPVVYTPIINDKTVSTSQTIHYEGAGDSTPADNIQNNFTFEGKENAATGVTTWNETSHTYNTVNSPVVEGYYTDQASVAGQTVTPDDPNKTITVTYHKLGNIVPTDPAGNPIPGHPAVPYTNDPDNPSQVTPNEPVPDIPGYTPDKSTVTPNDPGQDTPVVYTPIINDKTVSTSQTIHYEGAGDSTPADNIQNNFTFEGKENAATGVTTWNETSHTYNTVNSPVVEGYYTDQASVAGQTVTPDDPNKTITVTYHKLGNIVPTDPAGNPIPGHPAVPYTNDPDNPSQVTPNEPVPDIPGYTPDKSTVTPNDPGQDTPVVYTPIINDKTVSTSQTIHYEGAGDSTPADNIQNNFTFEGKENAATGVTTWNETSHTYNTVNSPVVEGYYTDQASVAGQTVTPDDPNKTITVTYHKLGNIVPTDPAGNPIPGHPAVPYTNDPDNPSQVTPNEPVPDIPGYTPDKSTVTPNDPGQDTPVVYTPIINDKTVSTSQTIHYEGAGDSTPADNIQNNFTFEGKENAATGVTTWNETSHTYNTVNSPVVEGYYTDQASVAGQTVTPDDPNKTITVTYHKLGNIVPTDPAGNPIPGHPAVPYTNDPDNPSQVTPNEPVPDIPGYTPDKSTVTPNDPGQDTPVVYTPIINDKTVSTSQTIHYEGAGDSTPADNIQNNFTFEGKENAATGVTTWNETSHTYNTVNSPVVEGYYTDQASVAGQTVTPDDPNKTITVTYHKLGNIVPTDPAGNPIPGHPAVPYTNDPDNPSQVTPNEPVPDIPGYTPDKSTVTPNDPGQDTPVVYTPIINDKTVSTSQTIHYEGAGDSTPADNIQNNFTFEGKENAATGVTTWNETSHTYNTVNSPVVEGYYTDQASVAGQTVTPDDPNKTITVTYHKLGNIVPTDPAGNPIPGHPAVPYTNDPDNPSQVTPNEPVPDIPGYTPDKSTVTPNDPGQDTPVVYTPIINDKTVSTSQTIHYEGAGDSTPADNIQNNFTFEGKENAATGVTTWNETSHTYNTVNSPVVEGYYTDQASVAGQTVTPDDPNKTITVTYHKLGNIVPTDPAGNPIPGHPAVPYTNDPDNPSQVTPNEPVPDIPGYTPDKSTVTPNDPGQDTPVVYTPIINDKTVSTSQTIHYEGAGDSTPADNIQNNFTELPQMGNSNDKTVVTLGMAILVSTLGVIGFKAKRRI
ncbi:hypothetical protein AB9M75_04550, partial [Lactobacillus sp. AN1001]